MNSENFPEFLKDNSKLYSVSFQELQSLVMEYPYSSALWKVLLCKAYFENKGDFQNIQESLAIRLQDRTKLKLFVQKLESLKAVYDIQIENRQVLDLEQLREQVTHRAMESEEFAAEESQEEQQKEQQRSDLLNKLFSDQEQEESQTEENTLEVDSEKPPANPIKTNLKEPVTPFKVDEELIQHISALSVAISTLHLSRNEDVNGFIERTKEESKKERIRPIPKSNFKSWKTKDIKGKKRKDYKKPLKAKSLAAKSLKNNNRIVSETLAQILEEQGYFDKAIQMYEQLCLKIPEKIPLFEAKINNLKDRR